MVFSLYATIVIDNVRNEQYKADLLLLVLYSGCKTNPKGIPYDIAFIGWFSTLPSGRSTKQIKAILKSVKFIGDSCVKRKNQLDATYFII